MTAGSPLTFPGSRTFAGWNKQFASIQPCILMAGHLRVVRVETLVRVRREMATDKLSHFLLDAIPHSGEISLTSLHQSVPITLAIVRSIVEKLEKVGLVRSGLSGFALTDSGRKARMSGTFPTLADERQSFYFLDLRPAAQPIFVKAEAWPMQSWPNAISPADVFGSGPIREALEQSGEWKRHCGFPEEVVEILDFDHTADNQPWRRVTIAEAERLSAAIVGVDEDGRRHWRVLPTKSEGWNVGSLEPVIRLPFEAMPALTLDACRQSFCHWCRSRRISHEEASACLFHSVDGELKVTFPATITDLMRVLRDELTKVETWLTVDVSNYRFGIRARPA